MHRIEEYCSQHGEQEELIQLTQKTADSLLRCSFAVDFRKPLWKYFRFASKLLQQMKEENEYEFKKPVEEFIHKNYIEDISLADIADFFGFSESYFDRTFKKKFGSTFSRFLCHYRLQESCKRLRETALTVEQVALECGFHSSNYFCTCFKKEYGMTPKIFREKRVTQKAAESADDGE